MATYTETQIEEYIPTIQKKMFEQMQEWEESFFVGINTDTLKRTSRNMMDCSLLLFVAQGDTTVTQQSEAITISGQKGLQSNAPDGWAEEGMWDGWAQ